MTNASHHKKDRIEQVYQFIVKYSAAHLGNFPTLRAIGDGCSITSSSVVSGYLGALEASHRVVYIDGVPCVANSRWLPPPVVWDFGCDHEIETEPTEVAPDGEGHAQAHGIRPALPHGRAVDDAPAGPGWKRVGRAPVAGACPRCGVTLPIRAPAKCENCGQALAVVGSV